MKMRNLVFACALVATLPGCMTYKYNGRDFRSEADALNYQRQWLSDGVAKITPARNRVGGRLVIYHVDQSVARAKLIIGNQNGAAADYILKGFVADAEKMREAFERRNFFDKVDLQFANGLHRTAEPNTFVVYYFVESANVNSFYYISSNIPRTAVALDRGAKEVEGRWMHMIEAVESLAAAEAIAAKKGNK